MGSFPRRVAIVLTVAVCAGGQRLRMTNGCGTEPIWIAHMASSGVGPDRQNVRLAPGETFAFQTTPGLSGTRYWPKMRCGGEGNGCLLGESGGPGETCDLKIGCAPPVDTKFEASFGADGAPDWVDVSLVDGWTLPFKFEMSERCSSGEGSRGVGTVVDCSRLSFASCPRSEGVGNASASPLSLEVKHPTSGGVVGCYSPCSKLTFSNWGNTAARYAPADPEVQDYCCPTPPESPGRCRRGPVGRTSFVEAVHDQCPGVYGYAYDDGVGLILCPSSTTYDMTFFCPKDAARAFPATAPPPAAAAAPSTHVGEGPQQEACQGAAYGLEAARPSAGRSEAFTISHHRYFFKDYVALRTVHGLYLAAEPDGFVSAASHAVSYWELFDMKDQGHGLVSLRSIGGKYLRAEVYGSVRASSDEAETFAKVHNSDGTVALRSAGGRYLSAMRACANDPLQGCFEEDAAYLPLDLPGTALTREALPSLCQARCAATEGCRRFTFYPQGGACHLQDLSALRVSSLGTVAGPRACGVPAAVRRDLLPSAGLLRGRRLPGRLGGLAVAVLAAVSALALAMLVLRRAQPHGWSSGDQAVLPADAEGLLA